MRSLHLIIQSVLSLFLLSIQATEAMQENTNYGPYDYRANNSKALGMTGLFADLFDENKKRAIRAFDENPDAIVTNGKTAREVLRDLISYEEEHYPKPILLPTVSGELEQLFGDNCYASYNYKAYNYYALGMTGLFADLFDENKKRAIRAFDENPDAIITNGKRAREVLLDIISYERSCFYISKDSQRIVHSDEKFIGVEFEIPSHDFKEASFTIPGFFKRTKKPQDISPWTIFYIHGGPHNSVTSRVAEDNWESDMDDMIKISGALDMQVVGFDFRGSILSTSCVEIVPFYKGKESTWKHVGKAYQDYPKLAKNFTDSVHGDYGGNHMKDLLSVYNYITKVYKAYVNPKKIIIAGHSFGGYTAVLAVMHPQLKDLFAASVSMSGFYDIPSELSLVTKGDYQDMRRSPIKFVPEINVPLIVSHGVHDENTLTTYGGSQNFVKALRDNGKSNYSTPV